MRQRIASAISAVVNLIVRARAAIERFFAPGFGVCYRCRRPWKFVKNHSTQFSNSAGCFPLCEKCWRELKTPQARWPYYHRLIEEWKTWSGIYREEKDAIFNAVMEGR